MVSETAYYFTNILSAVSFISNIDAQSLSMDEIEFEKNLESAQAVLSGLTSDFENSTNAENLSSSKPIKYSPSNEKEPTGQSQISTDPPASRAIPQDNLPSSDQSSLTKNMSISDLEEKGASTILKKNDVNNIFQEFPYVFASVGDLTLRDVGDLLNNYKNLVFKYACLAKGLGVTPSLPISSFPQPQSHNMVENEERSETSKEVKTNIHHTGEFDDLNKSSQSGLEIAESRPLRQDIVLAHQDNKSDEVSSVGNFEQVVPGEGIVSPPSSEQSSNDVAPSTEERHDVQ